MTVTTNATKASQFYNQQKRKERKYTILGFIRSHENQTAYSLSKYFSWPLKSVQDILKELEEEFEVIYSLKVENNRQKKVYRLTSAYDVAYDHFKLKNIQEDRRRFKMAQLSQLSGLTITIEKDDGSEIELPPDSLINDYIKNN